MKIAINRCWGGFGISHKAIMRYAELAGFELYPFVEKRTKDGSLNFGKFRPYEETKTKIHLIHYATKPLKKDGTYEGDSYWSDNEIERNDPILIQVIKELGDEANGDYAKIKIVDIPDDVEWQIDEYDGMESIHEKHRSW